MPSSAHNEVGRRLRALGFATRTTAFVRSRALTTVAAVALGCHAATPGIEEELSRALRTYVTLQEAYFADHGRYATHADSVGLSGSHLGTVTVISSSMRGHSAVAATGGSASGLLCTVWVGERPPELDDARQAEPVCGASARFARWLTAQQPDTGTEPADQVPPVINAPRADPAAPPVRSGVLLGLHTPLDGYRTIWIAGQGDSVAILARGPGLLVPRSDGFWRVEGPRDCPYVAAGPADAWPAGAVAHGRYWAGPLPDNCPGAGHDIEMLYVGPNYLSIRNHGDAPSGRAVDSWDEHYVMSLDSLSETKAVRMEWFVSPSSSSRLAAMATAKADSLRQSEPGCGWATASEKWAVRRRQGVWGLAAHYEPSFYACGRFSIPVPGTVPPELVSHNELFPDWDAILAVLPRASDAVTSPRRDLLVAVSHDSLYGFHVDGNALGRRAFAMAETGRIVMAEWAVGRNVERWNRRIRELLSDPDRGRSASNPLPDTAAASGQEVDYGRIFAGEDWSSGQAFLDWATVVPLRQAVEQECSDDAKNRLTDSIDDVLSCQRLATLGDDDELNGGRLIWSIVRSTAVPRYDCSAGIAYLDANRFVSGLGPAVCEYALEMWEPPFTPLTAFRLRATGAVGIVGNWYHDICVWRHAFLSKGDSLEQVHTLHEQCAR